MSAHVNRQSAFENNLPSQTLALEPRYLFDAAAVTTVADAPGEPTPTPAGTTDSSQKDAAAFLDAAVLSVTVADISDQGFPIDENLDVNHFAGQIIPAPDGVTFTIIEAPDSDWDAFAVSESGRITVMDNTKLDYEDDSLPTFPIETEGVFFDVPYLTFQVQADDGVTDPATITIFMLLQDVNDAPDAATPDDTTISLGETATVQVFATEQDIDGDSANDLPAWSIKTYELGSPPAGASINADGLFTWTPTEAGTTTITVKVSNVGELEQTVQFDVTVVPVVTIEGADMNMEDSTVNEGDAALFTVKLNGASDQPVTVTLSAIDGTADSPPDYNSAQFHRDALGETPIPGNILTFDPGVTEINIYVSTENDVLVEPDETFTMTATAATGASGSDMATGIIRDTTPAANNEATQIYGDKFSEEGGDEGDDKGGSDGGGPDASGDGPAGPDDEVTPEESGNSDDTGPPVIEADFSKTPEIPGGPQKPQTRTEEVAEIMSIMDKAIAIASCRELPHGPSL